MICPGCGATTGSGAKFCAECGTSLPRGCPGCGAPHAPGAKFCAECGTPLTAQAPPARTTAPPVPAEPVYAARAAERRLVSVLFADLVGFTSLSEARDSEEVRELLTRYFDVCRTLITRHGGTVEKFIGDAVMAVWGAPVANEDDAERAVRAALELVAAVAALGEDVGAPHLKVRAGVLTGEAAVTLGATGEGLVAGDLVNTASRIQSAAPPGAVLVGETTRWATEASVAYEPAGSHEVKGKSEPLVLYRALHVVAGARGAQRTEGLEAPFIGRDRELRMVKELFHATVDHRTPHLVTISGIAGIGKSRLSWEFEKYADGLVDDHWWHRGRCLSYGEGVTFWALADMMRMRMRIVEGEPADTASAKLAQTVAELIPDAEERRWIEPRLAQLLGLDDRATADQDDLFAAWRLFFERMADTDPVVLVFEDMQWADSTLLDFVDYLLEWSRSHPIFVLVLARPELMERRTTWGAGRRNFSSIYLEPLRPDAMEALLAGLVPGLPQPVTATILERAEGIPLYAVETVRMLLDQGLLERSGDEYHPTGPIQELRVPDTLHGLIAARLDGLAPAERRLVEDAAVLGKSFTPAALSAVSGVPVDALHEPLTVLVRREVLSRTSDPRSPDRGRYEFVQDLLQRVAYETLSRRDRKAKHLAVAAYLESTASTDDDDAVELLAAHYLEALRSAPDDDDAGEIKGRARVQLVRAGDRARALAAPAESLRYYEQAIEFTDASEERAGLEEGAGHAALLAGRAAESREHFDRAIEAYEAGGLAHQAARVSARLAEVDFTEGRLNQAIDRMDAALTVLTTERAGADVAELAAQLGRLLFFAGRTDEAASRLEVALATAEALNLPDTLSQALNTKSLVLGAHGRPTEADALLGKALQVALAADLHAAALRAYFNMAEQLGDAGEAEQSLGLFAAGLDRARRVGDRFWELSMLAGTITPLLICGRWDEALATAVDIAQDEQIDTLQLVVVDLVPAAIALVCRGELEAAREYLDRLPDAGRSEDVQTRAADHAVRAALARAAGDPAQALALAREALTARQELGIRARTPVDGLVQAVEAAFDLGDRSAVDELLSMVGDLRPGEVTPFLDAQRARFAARRDALAGRHDAAADGFAAAVSRFRAAGNAYWLAVTLLETAEHHLDRDRATEAQPLLDEARAVFGRLGARPMLERLDKHRDPTVASAG